MSIRWAVLPGFLVGSLCVFFMGNWIIRPDAVQAYALEAQELERSSAIGPEIVLEEGRGGAAPEVFSAEGGASEREAGAMVKSEKGQVDLSSVPQVNAPQSVEEQEHTASTQKDKNRKEAPAHAEDHSACGISHAYAPEVRQWCEAIQDYSRAEGLDPELVAALITQESGGNPQAYSYSGAVGLMQVMPRDGLAAGFMCINGPCFSARPSMNELYDPDFNISYGTRMLAGLVNKHGSIREALVAYGPRDVGYYYADKVLAIYNNYH